MIRWTPTSPTPEPAPQRWQSRAEILKEYLDSLSRDELLRVRPDYYPLRFEYLSLQSDDARKYDPNQPRVPAGNSDGGEWTNGTNALAARGTEAECEAQYKLDAAICRIVRTPLCWEQAMKRRAACISGYQLPPLNF